MTQEIKLVENKLCLVSEINATEGFAPHPTIDWTRVRNILSDALKSRADHCMSQFQSAVTSSTQLFHHNDVYSWVRYGDLHFFNVKSYNAMRDLSKTVEELDPQAVQQFLEQLPAEQTRLAFKAIGRNGLEGEFEREVLVEILMVRMHALAQQD